TGAASYGTDRTPDGGAFAAMATATITRGRIVHLDTGAAEAVPGVLLVLTGCDGSEVKPPVYLMAGGHAMQSVQPLLGSPIADRGQPIALVVADTPVAAAEAALLVRARYETEPFAVHLDDEGAQAVRQQEAIPLPFLADPTAGDAEAAFAGGE